MKYLISEGQHYIHADGDEYEVLNVSKTGVTFSTPANELVHMDIDDLVEHLDNDVLKLSDESENDEEDDDDQESEEEDDTEDA
jgi:hypothetical protein